MPSRSAKMETTTEHLGLEWNTKDLESRTVSVEKALQPLILEVTTLVNTLGPTKQKKGKSKRASVLVAVVEKAIESFIKEGEKTAYENPDVTEDMLTAVENVRKTGDVMCMAAREFSVDPCSSLKRGEMITAARSLLSAVTRLLILADLVDVRLLLRSTQMVESDLEKLKNASNDEVPNKLAAFNQSAKDLMNQAAKRQQELKNPQLRDDLAAARAVLKKHSIMLLTTSKMYARHPQLAAAKANKDYVYKEVSEAINTIQDVAQGKTPQSSSGQNGKGELVAALDDFDDRLAKEPSDALEEKLEHIISGASLMADSSCTRDARRNQLVDECSAVRQALQDLLSVYMSTMEEKGAAMSNMCNKSKDLRSELQKTVADHVSDSFLDTTNLLLALVTAARSGNESGVKELAVIFSQHSDKLVETANHACSMSNNEDGVKMVRYAAAQISKLCPQVVNAALVLVARPTCKISQENMDAFKQFWEDQLRILTEAVDDITAVDDFLAASESHIMEDINKCELALQQGDSSTFERTANAVRGRFDRVNDVVSAEMENYNLNLYRKRVLEAVKVVTDQVVPKFTQRVQVVVQALDSNPPKEVDDSDFIESSMLVFNGVKNIRKAVLMRRVSKDADRGDVQLQYYTSASKTKLSADAVEQFVDEYPGISEIRTAREAMSKMPEEHKQKIREQVKVFHGEKLKFDREVAKWEDAGNEIIVVARHMCAIMIEMADFTRDQGPLKTSMDVINAAKKISEAGMKLDKLARELADHCPESSTKQDLLAYLQRIALYCHQMNITSKVKADVQNISGKVIVSGLDGATSLIQTAKNLMNAVVLTVKASYVASTMYSRESTVAETL